MKLVACSDLKWNYFWDELIKEDVDGVREARVCCPQPHVLILKKPAAYKFSERQSISNAEQCALCAAGSIGFCVCKFLKFIKLIASLIFFYATFFQEIADSLTDLFRFYCSPVDYRVHRVDSTTCFPHSLKDES